MKGNSTDELKSYKASLDFINNHYQYDSFVVFIFKDISVFSYLKLIKLNLQIYIGVEKHFI